MNDAASTSWQLPTQTPTVDDAKGRSAEEVENWRTLSARVVDIGNVTGWSKSEVARRIGMPSGTFSQWQSGKYAGRLDTTNRLVSNWLDMVEEAEAMAMIIPSSPSFMMTRAAKVIINELMWAQFCPAISMITFASGVGKTEACKFYSATRPHVELFTASPDSKTLYGMKLELAAHLGVVQHNPQKIWRSIRDRLKRVGSGSLLIVDEAQNLCDEAVNQLRELLDLANCGVAFLGNRKLAERFNEANAGPSDAQIDRRISARLDRQYPFEEDLEALIDAWGVTDTGCRKLLTGIGMKPGALGQIDLTLKRAHMMAAGSEQPITADLIRMAWSNRNRRTRL